VARTVADLLWDDRRAVSNTLRDELIRKAKYWLRKNVFMPANILRAMDMKGGQLSMEGVEVLRLMEAKDVRY
jgi:hypothetical protein